MDTFLTDITPADSSPSTTVSSSTESVQESRPFSQPVLRRSGSLMISDAEKLKGSVTFTNIGDDCEENSSQMLHSTAANVEATIAGLDSSAEIGSNHSGVQLLIGKGKGKKWVSPATDKSPKQLLDLPVDVLREIINQVCFISLKMLNTSSVSP